MIYPDNMKLGFREFVAGVALAVLPAEAGGIPLDGAMPLWAFERESAERIAEEARIEHERAVNSAFVESACLMVEDRKECRDELVRGICGTVWYRVSDECAADMQR